MQYRLQHSLQSSIFMLCRSISQIFSIVNKQKQNQKHKRTKKNTKLWIDTLSSLPPFSKCHIAFPTSETRLQEKKKNERLSERGYFCILIPNRTARQRNEPKQDIMITAPWRWGVEVCVPVIMFIRNMGFLMRLAMPPPPPDPPFIADAIAIIPKGPSKPELYALSSVTTS